MHKFNRGAALQISFHRFKILALLGLALPFVAACGGGDSGSSNQVSYGRMVVFGDSLSDVGSYTPGAAALIQAQTAGKKTAAEVTSGKLGGKFSVNGPGLVNWTEFLSDQLGLTAPCPATTGWDSLAAKANTPATNAATCYNYAQGGSRVTNPVGDGNKALCDATCQSSPTTVPKFGALTYPIVTQVNNHLAKAATFNANDLVVMEGGANDIKINLAQVGAGALTLTAATTAVTTAATELVAQVNRLVTAGAKYVVVINVPDLANTPQIQLSSMTPAVVTQSAKLADGLVTTYNNYLAANLPASVLLVDVYTLSRAQIQNPAQYGLTNSTGMACGTSIVTTSSLVCSWKLTDATAGKEGYLFADAVHPTPAGYRLFAQAVAIAMAKKGWL